MSLLINWIVTAAAVAVSAYIFPGVSLSGFGAALLVALVLGLINVFIKPLLLVLALPITVLTLGLFTFVINAAVILMVSAIVPGFKVKGFWTALFFSVVLSFIVYLINSII